MTSTGLAALSVTQVPGSAFGTTVSSTNTTIVFTPGIFTLTLSSTFLSVGSPPQPITGMIAAPGSLVDFNWGLGGDVSMYVKPLQTTQTISGTPTTVYATAELDLEAVSTSETFNYDTTTGTQTQILTFQMRMGGAGVASLVNASYKVSDKSYFQTWTLANGYMSIANYTSNFQTLNFSLQQEQMAGFGPWSTSLGAGQTATLFVDPETISVASAWGVLSGHATLTGIMTNGPPYGVDISIFPLGGAPSTWTTASSYTSTTGLVGAFTAVSTGTFSSSGYYEIAVRDTYAPNAVISNYATLFVPDTNGDVLLDISARGQCGHPISLTGTMVNRVPTALKYQLNGAGSWNNVSAYVQGSSTVLGPNTFTLFTCQIPGYSVTTLGTVQLEDVGGSNTVTSNSEPFVVLCGYCSINTCC